MWGHKVSPGISTRILKRIFPSPWYATPPRNHGSNRNRSVQFEARGYDCTHKAAIFIGKWWLGRERISNKPMWNSDVCRSMLQICSLGNLTDFGTFGGLPECLIDRWSTTPTSTWPLCGEQRSCRDQFQLQSHDWAVGNVIQKQLNVTWCKTK